MNRGALISLIVAVFWVAPAWAVTVETVKSPLSINRGEGYKQVVAATGVNAGDQVMAGPGGRGRIVYPDGCAIEVYPGAVLTVPQKCYQPMRAGLDTPEPCDPNDPKSLCAPVERPYGRYLLYGAIATGVGVGICAAAGCFDDDDPRRRDDEEPEPASP